MKQFVVSVYDKSSQVFGRPVFVRSQSEATRSFESQVLEQGRQDYANPLNSHPEDFTLIQVGWFDDESGRFENLEVPLRLLEGSAVAAKYGAQMRGIAKFGESLFKE